MKAFLDTSVLVATFYATHEHHESSFNLFLSLDKRTGCTAAHCLTEIYATLTGMPGKDRVTGDEALLFLGNVRDRLTIVALEPEECFDAIDAANGVGVLGGGIYDALIGHSALKVRAQIIYTWNMKHFKRLVPDVASRVRTP